MFRILDAAVPRFLTGLVPETASLTSSPAQLRTKFAGHGTVTPYRKLLVSVLMASAAREAGFGPASSVFRASTSFLGTARLPSSFTSWSPGNRIINWSAA